MGTRFEFALVGEDESLLRSAAEAALEEVRLLSERLSAFSPASMLSYINTNAAERPVPLDQELFDLLELCRRGWEETDGAFDVTVGPLMRAWGFRGEATLTVEEAQSRTGMQHVILDATARTVRFARPGMSLDLGGIAKGLALDTAAAVLREAGVTTGLLHGGTSSALALGAPPGEQAWRIRIADGPIIELRDSALSVSAPRGRTIRNGDKELGHVLDPRSGKPTKGVTTAAAVGPCAAECETWSTTLLVLGERTPQTPERVWSWISKAPCREVCA